MTLTEMPSIACTIGSFPAHLKQAQIETPWGTTWIVGQDDVISGWWFEGQRHLPAALGLDMDKIAQKATGKTQETSGISQDFSEKWQPAEEKLQVASNFLLELDDKLGETEKNLPLFSQNLRGASTSLRDYAETIVWKTAQDAPFVVHTQRWLDNYLARRSSILPKIHLYGTPFSLCVWKELLEIPSGTTWTYGALAQRVGAVLQQDHVFEQTSHSTNASSKLLVRAIAHAVGRNPLSIIIPCHRVVGKEGEMRGYAGGIDRKIALLQHEGAILL